jgi:hypothetical protein
VADSHAVCRVRPEALYFRQRHIQAAQLRCCLLPELCTTCVTRAATPQAVGYDTAEPRLSKGMEYASCRMRRLIQEDRRLGMADPADGFSADGMFVQYLTQHFGWQVCPAPPCRQMPCLLLLAAVPCACKGLAFVGTS